MSDEWLRLLLAATAASTGAPARWRHWYRGQCAGHFCFDTLNIVMACLEHARRTVRVQRPARAA